MAPQQYAACIQACYACAAACDNCARACLAEDDVGAMAACIAMDIDCAEFCRLAAALMARNSPFASKVCALCVEICMACGNECANHRAAHCQECALACRFCAEECRRAIQV